MIKRLADRTLLVFVLVLAWKVALLLFFRLPVPSNDSFFYDGPVVNLLLHGAYANPSLVQALPYSGSQIFCAYPPLYQAVLLGWMWIFGTSAISAMWLHLFLFAAYMVLLLVIFRTLKLPQWSASVAAMFLFTITFHDRPDTLAHVLGVSAIYCALRSRLAARTGGRTQFWAWTMCLLAVLSVATGLQIGAVYIFALWAIAAAGVLNTGQGLRLVPLIATILIPVALVGLVIREFPHLWAGFLEHARQTPSYSGFRLPRIEEVLKVVRTVPGVLGMTFVLAWMLAVRRGNSAPTEPGLRAITLGCAVAALGISAASLFVLTPNSVMFAAYLQPIVVGCGLTVVSVQIPWMRRSLLSSVFIVLALSGSLRAIALSTWGIACARSQGYGQALETVATEIRRLPPNSTGVFSSAYLYEAARRSELTWIHSDWMQPSRRGQEIQDWEGLTTLKPAVIVLTQFDYYRRYQPFIQQLQAHPELARVELENTSTRPVPDATKAWQRVVQHLSWAPVVVRIQWAEQGRTANSIRPSTG